MLPSHLMTARLRLRPVRIDDLASIYRIWTQKDVRKYLWDGEVIAQEQALLEIKKSIESFQQRRYGVWVICQKDMPEVIGFCGLRPVPDSGDIELFYGIDLAGRAKGLVPEAAQAVLHFAFEEVGLQKIVAVTAAENSASVDVLHKLGMRREKRTKRGVHFLLHFSVSHNQLKQARSI